MKIAVIADLHANYVALQTSVQDIDAWQPDLVIVDGDIVNRGPRPLECLTFIQERVKTHGWQVLRGNHEDYVIEQSLPKDSQKPGFADVHLPSKWTLEQVGKTNLSYMKSLPLHHSLPSNYWGEARFTHGSMLGIRDGIYPETSGERLKLKINGKNGEHFNPELSLFCVGHTHRPVIRYLDGTLVINAGSTGLPFDGDQRLAYARLIWSKGRWEVNLIRLAYDLAQAEKDMRESGYLENAGPLSRLVLIELRTSSSLLYGWSAKYQQSAIAGEISVEDAVNRYIEERGL